MIQGGTLFVISGSDCSRERVGQVPSKRSALSDDDDEVHSQEANCWCCRGNGCLRIQGNSSRSSSVPDYRTSRMKMKYAGVLYASKSPDTNKVPQASDFYTSNLHNTGRGRFIICTGFQIFSDHHNICKDLILVSNSEARGLVSPAVMNGRCDHTDVDRELVKHRTIKTQQGVYIAGKIQDDMVKASTRSIASACKPVWRFVDSAGNGFKRVCCSEDLSEINNQLRKSPYRNGQNLNLNCHGKGNHNLKWHCLEILKDFNRNKAFMSACSNVARRNYVFGGRGGIILSVTMLLTDEKPRPEDLLDLTLTYAYLNQFSATSRWNKFIRLCQEYDPQRNYVLAVNLNGHVEVCYNVLSCQTDILPDLENVSGTRKDLINGFYVKQLSSHVLSFFDVPLEFTDPQGTLILTPLPGVHDSKAREVFFTTVLQKLRQRGVNLLQQFPGIYRWLCDYAESGKDFAPVSLYPLNCKTGRRFLCLIMPKSDAICTWMTDFKHKLRQEIIV